MALYLSMALLFLIFMFVHSPWRAVSMPWPVYFMGHLAFQVLKCRFME